IVCLPVRASSCLGYISRDSGQSLVPAPPDKITGINMLSTRSFRIQSSSNCIIAESRPRHLRRVIEVASVEYHRCAQTRLDVLEVGAAELAPFGHDDERIGALQGFVAVVAEHEIRALTVDPP